MKDNHKNFINDDGSYVVKDKKEKNIFAFIVCILLALVIWIYTTNSHKKMEENIPNDQKESVETVSEE